MRLLPAIRPASQEKATGVLALVPGKFPRSAPGGSGKRSLKSVG
jgi:hypothetical protein